MRSFYLAVGIGAFGAAAYAGCGLTTEGQLFNTAASTTSTGTGMMDAGPECDDRADCPPDSDCTTWACTGGTCILTVAPDGAPVVAGAIQGDCLKKVCKGGDVTSEPDDSDLVPDNDPCTMEVCSAGVKQTGHAANGTACGGMGTLTCQDGLCEGCNQNPSNCDPPTECQKVECPVNTCVYPIDEGKVLDDASPTDCKMDICNAQGNKETVGDTTETPPQMGDDCKAEVCDASGNAVQMNANEGMDCAPSIGDCYDPSKCVAGTCTPTPTPTGTRFGDDGTPNNCKATYCNGMGMKVVQADPTDLPIDPDPTDCTAYSCVGDMPSMMTKQAGAGCGMGNKCCGTNCCVAMGDYCDGSGACCASGRVCGGTCCQSGTASCVNNQCCETANVCNGTCCTSAFACQGDTGNCCPQNKKCGTNLCCKSNEMCMNGQCV
jgi:hypothetical protein